VSWLRIDDGFTANKKVAQLSDGEFRCWMRLLCHCAHASDPLVTTASVREVATLTKARVKRFAELGLLDIVDGGHVVHDWILYSDSSVAEKVGYYLRENPEASANEVVRAVGSKRELVLHEVKRLRGSESGSDGTGDTGSVSGSRTRAPDPTPPEPIEEPQAVASLEARRARDADGQPEAFEIPELVRAMP
jgi:hypothetical protein